MTTMKNLKMSRLKMAGRSRDRKSPVDLKYNSELEIPEYAIVEEKQT